MVLACKVLLGLFVALSFSLDGVRCMQVGASQLPRKTLAKKLDTKTVEAEANGDTSPDIENDLQIVDMTLDTITDIIANANSTAADMLEKALDGISTIQTAHISLKNAVKMVSMMPGGSDVSDQVNELTDIVNKSLSAAAEQLPPAVDKAVKQLTEALLELDALAGSTYSAYMAAQSALEALDSEDTTDLKVADRKQHSQKAGASLLELRASTSTSAQLSMDQSLSRKGSCDACCKAGKAISNAEKNGDLFFDSIQEVNEKVSKELGTFAEIADRSMGDVDATASKALEDAQSTSIPKPALSAVSKVLDIVFKTSPSDMAQEAAAETSANIDVASKKLQDSLKDVSEDLNKYYGEKCESSDSSKNSINNLPTPN